jgi:adenylate cyclase
MVQAGPELRRQTGRRVAMSTIGANLAGAVVAFLYLTFLAPGNLRTVRPTDQFWISLGVLPAYFLVATVPVVRKMNGRPGDWAHKLADGETLCPLERTEALGLPRRLTLLTVLAWVGAALLYGVINVTFGNPALDVIHIVVGILLGGLVTAALTYLLAERGFRPIMVLALGGEPADQGGVGVRTRLLVAWLVGSGLPLVALGLLPWEHAHQGKVSVAVSVASLALIGVLAGFLLTSAAARSVTEPLDAVRRGLGAVRAGDLSVEVSVDDPGEIGRLEADVNRMVEGLRERRRLEDLFGRHVGEAVARRALAEESVLGGALRTVSVLFVDLIGSTALAGSRPPDEVVALLNRLFGAVVEVVTAEGGWVNKFEGDGALCVFGAPESQPDHARRALRAARRLRALLAALQAHDATLDAGIGVATGDAVAGNVGARDRYEYTVIGDPVNSAARLSDLAKRAPGRLLATDTAVAAAGDEARHWLPEGEAVLRGRATATVLMAPADPAPRQASEDQPPATAGTIETV